jgi:4-hydroxybenzoate polyprenyltransferase
MTIRSVAWCVVEARPAVQVMFLLRFATAGVLTALPGTGWDVARIAGAALVWWAAVVAVYLFNGLADAAEDRANGSRRPIATERVSPGLARRWVVVFGLTALLGAWPLGLFGPVTLLLALGYLYSGPPFHLKRHPILAIVAALGGGILTYGAGYLVTAGPWRVGEGRSLMLFALMMTMWMGLVGGIAKDFSDIAGDAIASRRNLTLRLGLHRVRWLVSLVALTIGAAFPVAAWRWVPDLLPAALLTLGGAALLGVVSISSLSHGDRIRRRRPYRVFMVTQYATHLTVIATISLCC